MDLNESSTPVKRGIPLLILCFIALGISFGYAGNHNGAYGKKVSWRKINGTGVKTVVIDPGHGGKDPGCHGDFAHEKNICLSISLLLGNLIEKHYKDVNVVYTRKTDVFVELHNRAKIANDNKADLFICIHVNAGGDGKAYGAETYVMGLHKTETNLNVAKRENAVIEFEDDYKTQYEGFDPESPEGSILFSLYQSSYMTQSISFASKIQDEFKSHAGRHDRGVRQAGFLVLVYTAMPAVLIETGFATNQSEEKFLASEDGQTKMAESIFQAFVKYKKETEGSSYAGMSAAYKGVQDKPADKDDKPVENNQNSSTNNHQDDKPSETVKDTEPVYKVQFLSSKSKVNTNESKYKSIQNISYDYEGGWYKYMSGKTNDITKAREIKKDLVALGYTDAFIICTKNGAKSIVK